VAADREAPEVTFRADGAAALEWAARYLEGVGDFPVLAQVEPGDIRRRLPASPPERGEPFANVLRDVDEVLLPGTTHWQSPRFFAYFANSAAEPGILAELLAATLNSVAFIWRTSPASTELEAHTLDWTAQLLGLPSGWHGHIEDTASISTIAALAAARESNGGSVVVCSEEAHSSVERAARLLGLETRKVPLDDEFRLDAGALDLTDACALVATVGTTSTTAVDPVPVLADACEAAGVWLHVDAAYAGSAWVCPELRWSQAGVERADSLVVNAHKWLFTPMDCSAFFCRRPDDLRRAFSLVPEYLRVNEDVVSLSEYASPLGRRFRALKLWATLRCFGREGLQAIIREHVRLAELFEQWVEAEPGWELCAPRPFSLVCFRRIGSDEENAAIMERVNDSGQIFLSHTKLDDRIVLRLAIGNARTSAADVALAWEVLREAAAAG
jgi:aromatic-L-amino-acid decarboxylase